MFFHHDSYEAQAHSQLAGGHTAKLSHELIAAAASYEAAKAYEDHLKTQGKPVNHEKAVELLAAFTGGYIDRLAETKGLDAYDRHRLKQDAHERAKNALAQSGQF